MAGREIRRRMYTETLRTVLALLDDRLVDQLEGNDEFPDVVAGDANAIRRRMRIKHNDIRRHGGTSQRQIGATEALR